MMAKVIREYYRLTISQIEYSSPAAAIAEAYRIMADETGKPGWINGISIERVTVIYPIEHIFGTLHEIVTGTIFISSPGTLAQSPELSRYHPVNGWVIPDSIEIK